jgi:hypothetical protein
MSQKGRLLPSAAPLTRSLSPTQRRTGSGQERTFGSRIRILTSEHDIQIKIAADTSTPDSLFLLASVTSPKSRCNVQSNSVSERKQPHSKLARPALLGVLNLAARQSDSSVYLSPLLARQNQFRGFHVLFKMLKRGSAWNWQDDRATLQQPC